MKITALTMLVGVLAIAGIPLFSGWYSKDAILAQASASPSSHPQHFLLFLLPLVTAGLTTFYMFRMWFMTFTGKPRDEHVHEHAHESPLADDGAADRCWRSAASRVAWGWPIWDAEASWLEHQLHHAQPAVGDRRLRPRRWKARRSLRESAVDAAERASGAHEYHDLAGCMALGVVGARHRRSPR